MTINVFKFDFVYSLLIKNKMNIFEIAKQYKIESIDIENYPFLKVKEEEKCLARLWDKGDYGKTQCQNAKFNNCLCEKHHNASLRMGKWWLGLINEERPENPKHPISGIHKWTKDKNGNDYIVELVIEEEHVQNNETKEKRKRGRPKGSKNKK